MNNDFPSYLNRWTILGALIIAALLIAATLFYIGWLSPRHSADFGFVPAYLTIIPAPTHTPFVTPTFTPDPLLYGTATLVPNVVGVGAYVQIFGTEGEGLRIRSSPGLNADPIFMGFDEEVFLVEDGPRTADNYTWWYIVAPYDDTRAGWVVTDFLVVIPPP